MKNYSFSVLFRTLFLGGFIWMLFSCSQAPQKSENSIIVQLSALKGKGILFGHQDDLAYGVGWKGVNDESDVKRVTGDYPALFGWELGGLEWGEEFNLDSVSFSSMQKWVIQAYQMGGINTFSWHPYSPNQRISAWSQDSTIVRDIIPGGKYHQEFIQQLDRVALFFQGLKTTEGAAIPFIFRPWHEMDGGWFWWGSKSCKPEDLKALFRFTIEYLRNQKGLSQMVVAYSPDKGFSTQEEYLTWYPGDDVVDILGGDNYYDFTQPNGVEMAVSKLHIIINTANAKHKLAAFTETGLENIADSTWYISKLGAALSDSLIKNEISYVMVWRNASTKHFFFPYPSHASAADAVRLMQRDEILLLNDFNKLK